MFTTTFNLLINDFTPPQFIQKIEQGLTGSRFTYGLDTPINLLDLLNRVGVYTAIYALNYTQQGNTIGVQQAAGMDMLNAWVSIWNAYRPTDQTFQNLLTYTAQLQAASTPGPVNRNACGDVVSLLSGVTPAFVLGYANQLQTTLNGLSLTKQGAGQFATMQINPSDPYTPFQVAPDGTNNLRFIFSPQFIPIPAVLPGYVQHQLLEPNPATGLPELTTNKLIAEDQQYITYVNNHPGNVTPFATVRVNPGFSSQIVNNDANQAVNFLGLAAVVEATSVANGIPLLSSLAQLVDQAVTHFALDQRQQITDIQYEIFQVFAKAVPTESLPDYPNNTYATELIAIGNATKAALFTNTAFWQSFDADLDGALSISERYQAELGLNKAYYDAISQGAFTIYQTLATQLNDLINLSSNIAGILRPYLL